jgi:hypothetical protein
VLRSAAANFPVYDRNGYSLGGVNVSSWEGPAGTGVYRENGEGVDVQVDGLRDGGMNLIVPHCNMII